ncbi:DUF3954 domain-containing protein [Domibacillus tundrae]|uniref:DUF3954 domain-containing protein n=1 Tax=Domibacillus tundrae TaxID=1587527 RepID=UPI00061826DC|nr:DUF3954 domain-containing protein [Domibacillus tundrae]
MKETSEIKMTQEIDLMENATYYVKDGVLEKVDSPPYGHGSQTIVWQHGKPVGFDMHYTKRSR